MTEEFTNEFLEWARTHPTDVSAIGLNILIDHIDESHATIAQLTAERDAWRADAERFAEHYGGFDEGGNYCVFCGEYTEQDGITINHDNDCPITLHRELVEKYGQVVDK